MNLKEIHVGNWYNRVTKSGKSEPVETPIKISESDLQEIFGNSNQYSLCLNDLRPIQISRHAVSAIPQFVFKEDTDSWYDLFGSAGDIAFEASTTDNFDAIYICEKKSGKELFRTGKLHELQTWLRVCAKIELEYNPF